MPIYEYQCQACEAVVDELQKVSDPPLKKCPECGKSKLEKLVSAPSFRLSGTGWYETDFKSDGDKKRNLTSSDDAKGESKNKDGKSADKKKPDQKKNDPKKTNSKGSSKKSTKAKSK